MRVGQIAMSLMLLVGGGAYAQLYHCIDEKGQKVVQQMACKSGALVAKTPYSAPSREAEELLQKRIAFCRKASEDWSDWIESNRVRMSSERLTATRQYIEREQSYEGDNATRLAVRAAALLDKKLSRSESRADIYGLCMSLPLKGQ